MTFRFKYLWIIASLVIFSCSEIKPHIFVSEDEYRIFQTIDLDSYELVYGVNKSDTVAVVRLKNLKCSPDKFVLKPEFTQIDKLIQKSDTIYFSYYLWDVNKTPKILTRHGPPGAQIKTITTFNSYPYLQHHCENY